MAVTRGEAIAAMAAALLAGCSGGSRNAVRVGSKNFSEDITVAEIYAAALAGAGIPVQRRMDLGSTQIAMAAIQRGDIDLYPEYTGTGLIDVLHHAPMHDPARIFATIQQTFETRYGLRWLTPSPANDSQALAVTRAVSASYGLRTLSQCAVLAPRLRLAAIPEFVSRADALPGLQRFYGGFQFASVRTFEIGLQYEALVRGDAQVATAFTTDSQIQSDDLVVLRDDRHFWPPYNIAPLARIATLAREPRIATVLNALAPRLTDDVLRTLNDQVNVQKMDPADAAAQFLRSIR